MVEDPIGTVPMGYYSECCKLEHNSFFFFKSSWKTWSDNYSGALLSGFHFFQAGGRGVEGRMWPSRCVSRIMPSGIFVFNIYTFCYLTISGKAHLPNCFVFGSSHAVCVQRVCLRTSVSPTVTHSLLIDQFRTLVLTFKVLYSLGTLPA